MMRLSEDHMLLSLCAILRWFEPGMLPALIDCTEDELRLLLASDQVIPSPVAATAYMLREEVRAQALVRLRAEHPADELALHTRAFEYFLQQTQRSVTPDQRRLVEESCFYHLGELRLLLTERREWQTLANHIAAASAAAPLQARHRHQLAFYEGFVAIRTQNYDHGMAILLALLAHDDLEQNLRIYVLNALGHAHWYQTQYDQALAWYRQVYTLASQIGNTLYQGFGLLNMSLIYRELGEYTQALDLSLQSLHLFRDLRDSYREAHALYEVGNNAMQLGRWQVAQRHFEEAIRLYETLGVKAHLANLYWCQGFLHHILGDLPESEAAYLRGLAIAQSAEHGDRAVTMDIEWFLGLLYQTGGRWTEAFAAYEQAADLAHHLRNLHSLALIMYRRGTLLEQQGQRDSALAAYRQAIETIESLHSTTEAEQIKISLLGTTGRIYESMVLLCLELGHPSEAFDYVERARSRAFLDLLARKDPELYAAVEQPVVTLEEVQARLPADAVLIEYFTIGVLPRGEHLINKLPPANTRLREHLALPPQTLIFAVTRDRCEVHRAALDPNTLRPQIGDPGPGRRWLRERLLTTLYERLVGPVQHLLQGRSLLYLIPHGPLHYLPFLALRPAAGGYLLDAHGPAIALAPSATILLRNCLSRPRRQAEAMVALGYNDASGAGLRYAEAEARYVAHLMGGQAWTGPEPKSRRLMAAGPTIRWLHVAGHAVYNPRDPLESVLRLGADDALSAHEIIGGLDLKADLVTLSACTSGLSHVVPGDELLGLQRAFLYAGAPAVVCTLWEAADLVALLVMERFYAGLRAGSPAAVALRDAQVAVRRMTGRDLLATLERWRTDNPAHVDAPGEVPAVPLQHLDTPIYADPYYWAPFMLIGRPD